MGEGERSADHAWQALRRHGPRRLLRDAFLRFRSGDGFSDARALGLQLRLAAVPLLIAAISSARQRLPCSTPAPSNGGWVMVRQCEPCPVA